MRDILFSKNWKKKVAAKALGIKEDKLKDSQLVASDFKYNDKDVAVVANNCVVKNSALRSHISLTRRQDELILVCYKEQIEYFKMLFPEVQIAII
jgi:isopentenyldiphosphate isomerase